MIFSFRPSIFTRRNTIFLRNTVVRSKHSVPTSSLTCEVHHRWSTSFVRRSFSHSPSLSLRKTYFPRPNHSTSAPSNFQQLKYQVNRLPSGVILWTILGLNGVVYILWNIGIFSAVRHSREAMDDCLMYFCRLLEKRGPNTFHKATTTFCSIMEELERRTRVT